HPTSPRLSCLSRDRPTNPAVPGIETTPRSRPLAHRLLNANVEGNAFDVGQRGGGSEDLAVGDGAIGLEDNLSSAVAHSVAHIVRGLVDGCRGALAVSQEEPGLGGARGRLL